jgi:hypothetical protein
MTILFENDGVIPISAIKTFGVSAKGTDDAIGFFGTGLKYAIAIFLRLHCRVSCVIGGERYDFITAREEIRGKEFDIVCMLPNGGQVEELGFTTELGKTWEPWMAFRELYCNTIDEGGSVRQVDDLQQIMPPGLAQHKKTYFMVSGEAADRVWESRHNTILISKPIVEGPMANAHIGPGEHLYYRGIRVSDNHRPAKYDYNIHRHCDLTEDRTIKYSFEARYAITSLILQSEDYDFIRNAIVDTKDHYEADLKFNETNMVPGETFLDVVGNLRSEKVRGINPTAVEYHREYRTKSFHPNESIELTKVEKQQLKRSIEVCRGLGCDMEAYPIIVVDYLGQNILGQAENFHIYLSRRVFNMGTKMVAGTLYEEYIHIAEKLYDETRSMQNYLIDRLMTLYEENTGEPL